MVFKLWDRFWTLRDGLLDPLDRYFNPPPKIKNSIFWTFFHIGPLASHNRQLGPINRCWEACRLKILTSASHCLNMVSIRALGCPLTPKQGQIIDKSSIDHRYIFDISSIYRRYIESIHLRYIIDISKIQRMLYYIEW